MSMNDAQFQDPYRLDLSSVASLAFLVWDILITLDQEVEAIWTKPNKFYAKWLFLFVRYFAVSMQIAMLFVGTRLALNFNYTYSDCVTWYIFQEVGTLALIATVESILIVRVHALYDRSRIVTVILVLLFVVENVVMIITLVGVVPEIGFDPICSVVHSPPRLFLFGVAFVSFETVLFILTLFKFIVALRNGWGRTPVLFLLVRDGTWAFILIFVTLCVNAGFYLGEGNSAMSSIAFPWLLSIEAFAGARLVLNLHALPFDVSADSRSDGAGTLSSNIVFMSNSAASTHHARTAAANVRWDWGGFQRSYGSATGSRSRDESGSGSASGSGTRVMESYEMAWAAGASTSSNTDRRFQRKHQHGKSASTSLSGYTSQCSETCVDVDFERQGVA